MKFAELVAIRKEWVDTNKRNKFNFDSLLSGLYADSSHFIFELLQNAEDAKAKSVEFRLLGDSIEVIHDGEDFSSDDVEKITGIGIEGKQNDITKIGRFGVGFKSVFAISTSPQIHSGEYHFEISDYVIPKPIEPIALKKNTIIVIPFNSPRHQPSELYEKIRTRLENISLTTLLFLKNIRNIKWSTLENHGEYLRKNDLELQMDVHVKALQSIRNSESPSPESQYLVFSRRVRIGQDVYPVEIAYKLDKETGVNTIIPIPYNETKLVVFFPTERQTHLHFLMQAPFKTIPNRENIPLDDEQNIVLFDALIELVADSLSLIKQLDLFTVEFLQMLPVEHDAIEDEIYGPVFEAVKEKLLGQDPLLPTAYNGFTTAESSALARAKDLIKLLRSKDLIELFDRNHWLNSNITADKTPFLRKYLLEELEVVEVEFEDFSRKLNAEFLKKKTDKWIVELYRQMLSRPALLGEGHLPTSGMLRKKPVIRLSRDRHLSPFDEQGLLQVYLPTPKKSKYNTIKKSISVNKHAIELFKLWGITQVDSYAEIREHIIPKYQTENPELPLSEYLEDIKFILHTYVNGSNTKWDDIKSELAECFLILSEPLEQGSLFYLKPEDVYFRNEDLTEYFSNTSETFFISPKVSKKVLSGELFSELGVNTVPIIYIEDPKFTWEKLRTLRHGVGSSRTDSVKDYYMHHFDEFVESLDLTGSLLLWHLLEEVIEIHGTSIINGEYRWFYRSIYSARFPSRFHRQITGCEWLFDSDGHLVSPSDISLDQLNKEYLIATPKAESLIQVLNFKLDEVTALEQRTGGRFVPQDEYDVFLEWKASQEQDDDETSEGEFLDIGLEVETKEEPYVAVGISRPDLQDQLSLTISDDETTTKKSSNQQNNIAKYSKVTGRWGEEYVFKHLQKKYSHLSDIEITEFGFKGLVDSDEEIEVRWLNRNMDTGKGYDFLILNNGHETTYIEVKSTRGGKDELHRVSAAQWGLATALHESGSGFRYKLYVVFNARTEKAKLIPVSDPVGLWREGKLYAHPIHVRV